MVYCKHGHVIKAPAVPGKLHTLVCWKCLQAGKGVEWH